ncbi:hypothetical protein [Methyloprofundus sedimenti]|uniref:hypothetical protein n=1 Tax=Methyloprofundus sedimenti TaxID=1420851 RepID=UPI0038BD3FB7
MRLHVNLEESKGILRERTFGQEGNLIYEAGSEGPKAADELLARNGHQWRLLGKKDSGTEQTGTK